MNDSLSLNELTALFTALSDPSRIEMVTVLVAEDGSVKLDHLLESCSKTGLCYPTRYYHATVLRAAGLIKTTKLPGEKALRVLPCLESIRKLRIFLQVLERGELYLPSDPEPHG